MKYYLAIAQNDSTQTIIPYDNLDAALAAFHNELAYRVEGRTKTMCVILNSEASIVKSEVWKASEE